MPLSDDELDAAIRTANAGDDLIPQTEHLWPPFDPEHYALFTYIQTNINFSQGHTRPEIVRWAAVVGMQYRDLRRGEVEARVEGLVN